MTSDQMVSVPLIWQLGHVGKEADVFAKPPYFMTHHTFLAMGKTRGRKQKHCGAFAKSTHTKLRRPVVFVVFTGSLNVSKDEDLP